MKRKKMKYEPPVVKVTRVELESGIAIAQCSPINLTGVRVREWEDEAQLSGDGDVLLVF